MRKLQTLLFFSFMTLMIFSCKKDENLIVDTKLDKNGLTKDITNFVPDSIIEKMKSFGMPIYGGENPPMLTEGGKEMKFFVNNFKVLNSNVPTDFPGQEFKNYIITLNNQDSKLLKIDYKDVTEDLSSESVGRSSYIVGSDNKFTIFVDIHNVWNDSKADLVLVISGEKGSEGILNLHYSNFMLNDYGDPAGVYLEVGQGRVARDTDGVSEYR